MSHFDDWQEKIAWGAIVGIVIGGASWMGWITIQNQNHLTSSEVSAMIERQAPYTRDRSMILSSIKGSDENEALLATIIERNTRIIERNTAAIGSIDRNLARISAQIERKEKQ